MVAPDGLTIVRAGGLAVLVLAVCAVRPAGALEFTQRMVGAEQILSVTGPFLPGDEGRFVKAVEKAGRVDEVWLSSDGGSLFAGLAIGRALRKAGLATRIPAGAECASACAYAFIGGVFRTVDPKGRVGVHMTSRYVDPEVLAAITGIIQRYGPGGAREVIPYVEQWAARSAAAQAKYLVEMSVSLELMTPIVETHKREIHWLSRSELQRYNVVNQ